MKSIRLFLIGLLFLGGIAATASAIPIDYVSATTVMTTYDHTTGVLTLDSIRPLDVYREGGSHTVVPDVRFHLTTDLVASTTGAVSARFEGGSIALTDGSGAGTVLLSGTVDYLLLMEMDDGIGVMTAMGKISSVATTGDLADWFGGAGVMYDLIFEVVPITISDLATESFSGNSDVTLSPIPEPLTIGLLGIGLAGMAIRRRKR